MTIPKTYTNSNNSESTSNALPKDILFCAKALVVSQSLLSPIGLIWDILSLVIVVIFIIIKAFSHGIIAGIITIILTFGCGIYLIHISKTLFSLILGFIIIPLLSFPTIIAHYLFKNKYTKYAFGYLLIIISAILQSSFLTYYSLAWYQNFPINKFLALIFAYVFGILFLDHAFHWKLPFFLGIISTIILSFIIKLPIIFIFLISTFIMLIPLIFINIIHAYDPKLLEYLFSPNPQTEM